MKQDASDSGSKLIAQNKKARFDYHIIETLEAGLVLTGAEIKSVRAGGVSLQESYIRPRGTELFLVGAHITPYSHAKDPEYDPIRPRKLLLHRREIEKLSGRVSQKGLTIVPLRIYLKRGRAKLEVGLAKGKSAPDRRDSIKSRESAREIARYTKREKS